MKSGEEELEREMEGVGEWKITGEGIWDRNEKKGKKGEGTFSTVYSWE